MSNIYFFNIAFDMDKYWWASGLVSTFNETTNKSLRAINTQLSFMKPRNFRDYLICYISGMNVKRMEVIKKKLKNAAICHEYDRIYENLKSLAKDFWNKDVPPCDCIIHATIRTNLSSNVFN